MNLTIVVETKPVHRELGCHCPVPHVRSVRYFHVRSPRQVLSTPANKDANTVTVGVFLEKCTEYD